MDPFESFSSISLRTMDPFKVCSYILDMSSSPISTLGGTWRSLIGFGPIFPLPLATDEPAPRGARGDLVVRLRYLAFSGPSRPGSELSGPVAPM